MSILNYEDNKGEARAAILEAAIIFMVLFLPGVRFPAAPAEQTAAAAGFSAQMELGRLVLRNIPALALVWYMLIRGRTPLPSPGIRPRDFAWAFLGLAGLGLVAACLALIALKAGRPAAGCGTPDSVVSWFVLVLSSLSTGYLEESYFRVYLFSRLGACFRHIPLLSVLLFGLCHLYEGYFGFANAILAGAFLSVLYLKTKSFHGIALAHGFYNITAYITAAITTGRNF